ncbi:MAG: hypothetical protein ACM3S1_07280 [Hyphomicrobiales bacterium]
MSSDLESQLEARGALLRGHFQLASGRHADTYIEKFRILQWPDITEEMCARIAGVGMLVDRSGGRVDFGVPFFACLTLDIASWDPADCKLCQQGVELTIT